MQVRDGDRQEIVHAVRTQNSYQSRSEVRIHAPITFDPLNSYTLTIQQLTVIVHKLRGLLRGG